MLYGKTLKKKKKKRPWQREERCDSRKGTAFQGNVFSRSFNFLHLEIKWFELDNFYIFTSTIMPQAFKTQNLPRGSLREEQRSGSEEHAGQRHDLGRNWLKIIVTLSCHSFTGTLWFTATFHRKSYSVSSAASSVSLASCYSLKNRLSYFQK